jgi:hypothetical protein
MSMDARKHRELQVNPGASMRRVSPRGASHPTLIRPIPVASTVMAKPLAWIMRRRAKTLRYEIRSWRRPEAGDTRLLERAFARLGLDEVERVTGVEVSAASGCLVVAMDIIGPPSHAEGECERLFSIAWYDAFGVRGSRHVARLVEVPASA